MADLEMTCTSRDCQFVHDHSRPSAIYPHALTRVGNGGVQTMADLEMVTYDVTCHGAPMQVQGSLSDGRRYYFRARHRAIELGVGATDKDAVGATVYGGNAIRLSLDGFEDDAHPLSCIEEGDLIPLVKFMIHLFDSVSNYEPSELVKRLTQ